MGGGWGWRAARGGCSSVFFRLLALFTACPHGHLGDPQGRARREDFSFSSPAPQTEAGRGLPPIAGASCGRSQPPFPPNYRENFGVSSERCRACLRKACFLLRSTDRHFFTRFPASPPVADGNFRQGTEPSPPARAAPGPRGWLQPGCGCKYSRLLLPEPISLQGCSARIDESPRCPRSCRRQQDPGASCSVSPAPILKPEPVPQTLQLVAGMLGSIISHYLGTHPHETP